MDNQKDYIVHDDYSIRGFSGKYRFLSNFYPAPVYFEGLLYQSSEHAYQAAKVDDQATRATLFLDCTAGQAKRNGKIVTTREDWHRVKFDVMSVILFEKFYRNYDLRLELLATGKKLLEETNHWGDKFWGVCDGVGENNLGIALMGVRSYWGNKYPELLGKPVINIKPLF